MSDTDRLAQLPAKLDRWIELQREELTEFEDRNEAEQMEGALEAFEAVRAYLTGGAEPMFMTLR